MLYKSMKFCDILIICFILASNTNVTAQVDTLMSHTGVTIIQIQDEMTDEISCSVRLQDQVFDFIISSHERLIVSNRSGPFSFEDANLIRVGNKEPMELTVADPPDALIIQGEGATEVIQALSSGDQVRFRYYDWPERIQFNRELEYPSIGYAYSRAISSCGWKDIGVEGNLEAPVTRLYEFDDSVSLGFLGNPFPNMRYSSFIDEECSFDMNGYFQIKFSDGEFSIDGLHTSYSYEAKVIDSNGYVQYKMSAESGLDTTNEEVTDLVRSILEYLPRGKFASSSEFREYKEASLLGFDTLYSKAEDLCQMRSIDEMISN